VAAAVEMRTLQLGLTAALVAVEITMVQVPRGRVRLDREITVETVTGIHLLVVAEALVRLVLQAQVLLVALVVLVYLYQ
jgi:hypothetical protein